MRIKMKLTALVNRKLGEVKSVKKEDLLQFGKNCLPMLFTVGFFLITNDASAQTTSTAGNVGITPLQKPLQVITDALTGPIPILVTGGGIALGGMSWAMGWEQQAMMRGVKIAGGGAIAMGAGQFLESTLSDSATLAAGLLF